MPAPNKPRRSRRAAYADVELELTRLTFRNYTPSVLLGNIAAISATLMMATQYADFWLWKLTWVMIVICCARTWYAFAFDERRSPQLTLHAARRQQRIWATVTILFSACMAACALYTFARHESIAESICIMGIFALTSAMSSRMTVQPRVLRNCGLIMLGSLAAALLLYADPLLARAGAMVCLFYAVIHSSAIDTKFEIAVEHLRLQHKLRELAERDPLTGLANRRHFEARLAGMCAEAQTFAVLYLDLDRFKRVNDAFGHPVGDVLLQRVGERISGLIRSSDLLARLGGDEFAILQHPVASEEHAQTLAARINRELALPFEIAGHQVEVGSSIGIRMASAKDCDPSRLLNQADQALYRVKQAGGGGFRIGEFQN